jgi:hypothetical protein
MKPETLDRRAMLKLMTSGFAAASIGEVEALSLDSPEASGATPVRGLGFQELVPDTESIFGRIEEICSWGVRRPAYPADRQAEEYALREFERLGLVNVRKEPAPLMKWEPMEHSLRVETGGTSFEIDCFPLPHSALDVDLELELALYEAESPAAIAGKAALHRYRLIEAPATILAEGGTELESLRAATPLPVNPEGVVVDPGGTLATTRQILPFPPGFHDVIGPSVEAGALAFIGVLEGHPGDICEYYMPYDAVDRPFPAVWIKASDGRTLANAMRHGPVNIHLEVRAVRKEATSYNIVGELPGPDYEIVMIGSHHDAPWASAVEDASGIALVLAQAEYWARVPRDRRPHEMHFVLQAGHMAYGAGGRAFIKKHRETLDRVVLEVHLEHAANEMRAGEHGLEPTGEPEPRWFFTSRNPDLQRTVIDALLAENLDRSLVLAPDVIGSTPSTDGAFYHAMGVPIVNYLTAPFYLFDTLDTPDKIHKPSLEGVTRATIRILQYTRGISAARMRDGVTAATSEGRRS